MLLVIVGSVEADIGFDNVGLYDGAGILLEPGVIELDARLPSR